MQYLTFTDPEGTSFPVCLFVKILRSAELVREYVSPLNNLGVARDKVIAYQNPCLKKKTDRMEFYKTLFNTLTGLGTRYIIIPDAQTMKDLTGYAGKVDGLYGYVLPITLPEGSTIHAIYTPSPVNVFHHPEQRDRITAGVEALVAHAKGGYQDPGSNIIKHAEYPTTNSDIAAALDKLLKMECPLTIDIEAFDLKHYNSGIGTITFCWNQHEGIAFPVDYSPIPNATSAPFGEQVHNESVRAMLKHFFKQFRQKAIYHKINFDVYVLIYQLFMKDLTDTEGLLEGLDVMLRDWDDTLIITYLATNSCAGNQLGLKVQSQEYSGNYAVEVSDICSVPLNDLLRYNLIDGLSTWYVHQKHYQTMVDDNQLDIYQNLLQPSMKDIIQMQLTGLPINQQKVAEGKAKMVYDQQDAVNRFLSNPLVKSHMEDRAFEWATQRNSVLKKKRVTHLDYKEPFNLSSPDQLNAFLYDFLGLPIIDKSKSGGPSTKRSTMEKLLNHTQDQNVKDALVALVDFKFVEKILTAFIPAFEEAPQSPDGQHYLFGFFNIGGTLSGRLSASDVNLQQLPASGSRYAKLVKQMFSAPPGWLFCGLDYDSLEDRISALTTKDPNKLKVYTDGYDGHCLRAFSYFRDEMPDIEDTVESINSFAVKGHKYGHWRQLSKAPTFALTYQGTYVTLMNNCGFSKELALKIEANYHELYKVSDEWVRVRIEQAQKDGYITVAFGLRVRTPLLAQCILGARSTPYEAAAEGRTAGNALGQSYGMLNQRAMMAFMQKVRSSMYRLLILPCAQIHDAQYYLVRNDLSVLAWMNRELVKEVKWQELPEIQHDQVKLSGNLGIFYPNWAVEMTLPHDATADKIKKISIKHLEKLNEPGK